MRRPLVIYGFATTLRSRFPYTWGNFFFISAGCHLLFRIHKTRQKTCVRLVHMVTLHCGDCSFDWTFLYFFKNPDIVAYFVLEPTIVTLPLAFLLFLTFIHVSVRQARCSTLYSTDAGVKSTNRSGCKSPIQAFIATQNPWDYVIHLPVLLCWF